MAEQRNGGGVLGVGGEDGADTLFGGDDRDTLFGGLGTLWGPLIGAAVLIPLGDGLHGLLGHTIPGIQSIVYGAALILAIMIAPEALTRKANTRSGDSTEAARPT